MDKEIEEKSIWTEIRSNLDQNFKFNETWEQAIQLFEKRLKWKYFDPHQKIIDKNILKGEGFTIVTVQCALIEMFAAFRNGKIFNHNKQAGSPKYEYKESQKMFISILRSSSVFEDNFWQYNSKRKPVIDRPFSTVDFYKFVRCGLIDEARTKENWIISATPRTMYVQTEKKFLVQENGKIKIYRTILHYKLLIYLKEYLNELHYNNAEGELLRKNFARKMDHLYDFVTDIEYSWWKE
jgi:hypothetical protein